MNNRYPLGGPCQRLYLIPACNFCVTYNNNDYTFIAGDRNYKVLTDVPQVADLKTPIVLDGLNCVSDEGTLGECQSLPVVEQCTHDKDAGANCTVIIGWQQ